MGSNEYKVERADGSEWSWPLGAMWRPGGAHFAVDLPGEACFLLLWKKGELAARIPIPEENRLGTVRYLSVTGPGLLSLEYSYEADGREVCDPCGCCFTGRERYGDPEQEGRPRRCRIYDGRFEWGEDHRPELPFEDCIFYRLHPRGFTMHPSSRVKDRGTLSGIRQKIPYLKELGVTSLELMLPVEFEEVMYQERAGQESIGRESVGQESPKPQTLPDGSIKVNYWGYGPACLFAPKSSYASGRVKNPVRECKELIRELHANGMELILELYVTRETPPVLLLNCLRFWVAEYHVDGFHLSGEPPVALIAGDPALSRAKLLADSWAGVVKAPGAYPPASVPKRYLGEYNDGFLVDMRRFLKGDEAMVNAAVFRVRRNPDAFGVINYMANTNGFTLMDMVSYEQKHNEANGEENQDGSDFNFTWNCGAEGKSRGKKVKELRRRQLYNAAALLFLSQGTPLLLAGDEFGHTQMGNNNAYCQDNEVSWLNWNNLKTNKELYEFIRALIDLRKRHRILHMPRELRGTDYKACGHPDISFHGVRAWCLETGNSARQLGILYCGDYAQAAAKEADDDIYVAMNMHWEPCQFALPNLDKTKRWYVAVNTGMEGRPFYEPGEEPQIPDQKHYTVGARSVVVFLGRESHPKTRRKQK